MKCLQVVHWMISPALYHAKRSALNTLSDVCFVPPTGRVTIPSDITFQLNTDPATDPPVFTLTCTSTGGPATTVSWRRDGTMLSDDNTYSITSQVLTDAEIATYTHTLTVTGRLLGEYQCSVSNIRKPSGSSRSLTVVGKYYSVAYLYMWGGRHVKQCLLSCHALFSPTAAGSPTNLNAVPFGLTSFRVSWAQPATVTGYQVYWSGSGGVDSGNVSAGAGDIAVTITGRTPGLMYNITIVALSDHLPSPVVGAVIVYTPGEPHILTGSAAMCMILTPITFYMLLDSNGLLRCLFILLCFFAQM